MAPIPLEDEDLEFLMGPNRKQFILEDTKKVSSRIIPWRK